jgi:hypothetical protein
MQNFELQLHKGLPIITDKLGQRFILDTGSPSSFCESGQVDLYEGVINVPKKIMQVDAVYLQENIGIQLDGLLGLDILGKKSFSIQYNSLSFIIYDSINEMHVVDGLQYFEATAMIFKIPVSINDASVNLILDTGAHISYLNPEYVSIDTNNLRTTNDFNPLLGNFEASMVEEFEYSINGNTIIHEVGLSPNQLKTMLGQLRVGGVFGYDLFTRIDFYYLKEENRIAIKFIN